MELTIDPYPIGFRVPTEPRTATDARLFLEHFHLRVKLDSTAVHMGSDDAIDITPERPALPPPGNSGVDE